MPLIGTAGHVDHGKSTLVQALSGRDPDRWVEEKRRGLTIDLGFAWADLGTGQQVSFVDVPGHERYLKNMLAGIEAIDIALLVVAANEGWMPQTEEHVAVLDLLGVSQGVVAVSKTDLVDNDTVDLAVLEAEDRLEGTSLQGAPIIPISATNGDGMPELRRQLALVVEAKHGRREYRTRLWVDRAFTVSGTGTVVTGSLLGGPIRVGDDLKVHPSGVRARVRSLQTHEAEVDQIDAGRRAAIGLSGVDSGDVARGDLLAKDDWRTTTRFVAQYRLARYVSKLPTKGAFQIHIGSRTANVAILKANEHRVIVDASDPLPLVMGERFIIRDTGRRQVIAGGQILDPYPVKASFESALDVRLDPADRANQLLAIRGQASLDDLRIDSDGGTPTRGFVVGETAVTEELVAGLVTRSESFVATEHRDRPLRNGVAVATLAEQLGIEQGIVELVIDRSDKLEVRGPDVAELAHEPRLTPEQVVDWDHASAVLAAGLEVPLIDELRLSREVVHFLIRQEKLIPVSESLVYLPSQIAEIVDEVASLPTPFAVGEIKEKLGLSRKYVVPILEWLDSNHYTRRRGDTRVFGPRLGSS